MSELQCQCCLDLEKLQLRYSEKIDANASKRAVINKQDKYIKRQDEILKVLTEAVDETVAIIAHINPDTYNNSEALTMVGSEMLKTLEKVKGMV